MTNSLTYEPRWGALGRFLDRLVLAKGIQSTQERIARRIKHYYALESVGIATGILIAAVHNAGLASLTHTPSPMGFLNRICDRPANERPFLILVVGYPSEDAVVPDIGRKSLEEIASYK